LIYFFCCLLSLFSSVAATAETPLNFESLLATWKRAEVRGPEDALKALPKALSSQYVQLHTSRSLHRATEAFPRRIYFANRSPQDKNSSVFLAVSHRPEASPVLEVLDYDFAKARADFYALHWDEQGGFHLAKNPPVCFNCHSGGRALWTGISREKFWPDAFGGPEWDAHNLALEKTLSQFNAEIQSQRLLDIPDFEKHRQSMEKILTGEEQIFKRSFWDRFKKSRREEITTAVTEAHEVFAQMIGHGFSSPPINRRYLSMIADLAYEFYQMGAIDFLNLLSLNPRPHSFEISEDSLEMFRKILSEKPSSPDQDSCKKLLPPAFEPSAPKF
jgi:hypothetical protein